MLDKYTVDSCFVRESCLFCGKPSQTAEEASHAAPAQIGSESNQSFVIVCTHYPTNQEPIKTLYEAPGHFQSIPCQFSKLSIEWNFNLSSQAHNLTVVLVL